MAGLLDHGDVGRDPLLGELNAAEQVFAPSEAFGHRGLAAVLEHQEVVPEPQPPAPAPPPAPGDQVGRAVETVAHQHRPNPCGQQAGHHLQGRALLGEADRPLRRLDPPRQRQGAGRGRRPGPPP
jgi:hypothetical protein